MDQIKKKWIGPDGPDRKKMPYKIKDQIEENAPYKKNGLDRMDQIERKCHIKKKDQMDQIERKCTI
jgi:hypothetical protein